MRTLALNLNLNEENKPNSEKVVALMKKTEAALYEKDNIPRETGKRYVTRQRAANFHESNSNSGMKDSENNTGKEISMPKAAVRPAMTSYETNRNISIVSNRFSHKNRQKVVLTKNFSGTSKNVAAATKTSTANERESNDFQEPTYKVLKKRFRKKSKAPPTNQALSEEKDKITYLHGGSDVSPKPETPATTSAVRIYTPSRKEQVTPIKAESKTTKKATVKSKKTHAGQLKIKVPTPMPARNKALLKTVPRERHYFIAPSKVKLPRIAELKTVKKRQVFKNTKQQLRKDATAIHINDLSSSDLTYNDSQIDFDCTSSGIYDEISQRNGEERPRGGGDLQFANGMLQPIVNGKDVIRQKLCHKDKQLTNAVQPISSPESEEHNKNIKKKKKKQLRKVGKKRAKSILKAVAAKKESKIIVGKKKKKQHIILVKVLEKQNENCAKGKQVIMGKKSKKSKKQEKTKPVVEFSKPACSCMKKSRSKQ